ncbi:MAG: PilW family protein [Planctomycetota bacterium]
MTARRHNQGLSLLEVAIVVAVSAIVMAGAATYFRTLRQAAGVLHARRDALQNARVALERMTARIRAATEVTAISAPTDTAGAITLTDADGVNHVFALVGTELLYGIDSADSVLATGIQSLTFQGYDDTGTAISNSDPASIRAVVIALTATVDDSAQTGDLTARARLRQDLVVGGEARVSRSYASDYATTGSKGIAGYSNAFGAPDGDKCHKNEDEAGKFYGFQPGSYAGTIHRIYAGGYFEHKDAGKPLTVTVRHGTTTMLEHTYGYYETQAIQGQWVWQWFDVTDSRASWTEADISALSIELGGNGDVEAQCLAIRAVFDPTELAAWWADRQGSGACPNEWSYADRALGAPDGSYATAAFGKNRDYQSYRVTVPSSDTTILTVETCVHGGPSGTLLNGDTLRATVALPADGKDNGRRYMLDDTVLDPFAPYSTNGGDILTDVSADRTWTWADLNDYEIRFRTDGQEEEEDSRRLHADAVGWRVRYAEPRRGILRWSE